VTATVALVVLGAAAALAGRALMVRLLLVSFRRDVARLNRGDYSSLLDRFSDGAVLRFNEGEHRWSGDHVGKPAIERFLREFTRAGLNGELLGVWAAGPPWALRLVARFDDWADGPGGERLYENSTCLLVITRWGKIVEQRDFYADTAPIAQLERRLTELGTEPLLPAALR
jgi:ketosteroid isomerase-like protein